MFITILSQSAVEIFNLTAQMTSYLFFDEAATLEEREQSVGNSF